MFESLKNHALENVWCAPDQDKQFMFRPARISRGVGVKNSITIMKDVYGLPTKNEFYHVYQIGQIHPIILGLIEDCYQWRSSGTTPTSGDRYSNNNVWYPFSQVCNLKNMVVDIYNEEGRHWPLQTSYVLVTDDKNLIIAVKEQPKVKPLLNNEHLYIRMYSNAFFSSVRASGNGHQIISGGRFVTNAPDIVAYSQQIALHAATRGYTFIFVNGLLVHNLTTATAQPGDLVDYLYDSTVDRIVDIAIEDVDSFTSTLDQEIKYLLTYPESDQNDLIDYHDDIDFYLIRKPEGFPNNFKGCYYHKNTRDSVRMVTHKDYSIVAQKVAVYNDNFSFFGGVENITVRLFIRSGGFDRPLVDESHRIKELYKLSDERVKGAMVGINSTLNIWQAAVLEASKYPTIMRSRSCDIDKQMIEDAYGYNAISKVLANTPQLIVEQSSIRFVKLPFGLQINSTMFEYDADGVLLERHNQVNDVNYFPHNNAAVIVEGVMGEASDGFDSVFGQHTQTLNPYYTYRMYKTRIVSDVVDNAQWEDVTGTDDYTIDGDNLLTWLVDEVSYYTCVRSDKNILIKEFDVEPSDNLIVFDIVSKETHSGHDYTLPLSIPMGKLDIWLNKKYLIENLDYYIKWPQVVIVNKEYLVTDTPQSVLFRGTGFCRTDMTVNPAEEFGFVYNQALSKNTIFDVRDDKVVQIVIEGCVKRREDLHFKEDSLTVMAPGVRNGAPYVIKDVLVPLRDCTVTDYYELKERSELIDAQVSDYLTMWLGETVDNTPNPIPHRYNVFSPFCSKLIYDIKNSVFVHSEINGHYSEMDIAGWLEDYMYLLENDPCRKDPDINYVTIHPHPFYTTISLTLKQYAFVERVIGLYLFNKVDLSQFVTIEI